MGILKYDTIALCIGSNVVKFYNYNYTIFQILV